MMTEAECSLQDAAIRGDESIAQRLFLDGANANEINAEGTSVIGALVLGAASFDEVDASHVRVSAPARLAILTFLLDRRAFSLYALNASDLSLNGLTPLGMAAYLGRLDFVTALVEKCDGLVLVDGVDSHRATPLMYAARDGHTDVVDYLISQGARPDSADCNNRSVLFYAVSHPHCLASCEKALRLQRAQSLLSHKKKRKLKLALQHDANTYVSLAVLYQQHPPVPSSVQLLVNAVSSSNLVAVRSLLFPSNNQFDAPLTPALANLPDENGWSPIHYCVSAPRPNAKVLDALFMAGADLALYTADNTGSPLHVLARAGDGDASFRMYAFVVHLVRDLGAPLDAVDQHGNTCIHVAAQHGRYVDVLMAFLECDPESVVRKMRNSAGQTALDVAKAEFRMAFEPEDGFGRPDSAASMRTVKASFSSSSLTSSYSSMSSDSSGSSEDEVEPQEQFPPLIPREKRSLRAVLGNSAETEQLIKSLELISKQLTELAVREGNNEVGHIGGDVDLDEVEALLHSNWNSGVDILERFRQLADAELEDLQAAREVYGVLDQLIMRLQRRVQADDEQKSKPEREAHEQTPLIRARPSLAALRSNAATPSLVASGPSSSHSSFSSFMTLADLAALATPTTSPRIGRNAADLPNVTDRDTELTAEEDEHVLDFACALAAGSATRMRRASMLNAIDYNNTPSSPLEAGVNLFSVPPERAPEVEKVANSHRESWLNPYVRGANSQLFQDHLKNLLVIEKTLFGEEDAEREYAPNPLLVQEESACWREGVEALTNEENSSDCEGNFLEMADGEARGLEELPFDDGAHDSTDERLDVSGTSTTHGGLPTRRSPQDELVVPHGPISTSEILLIAKRESSAIEGAMNTAARFIDSAEQYIGNAERLMSKIFQEKEHEIQAARLSLALHDLSEGDDEAYFRESRSSTPEYVVRTPASSPTTLRAPVASHHFPPPPTHRPTHVQHGRDGYFPSIDTLQSILSPTFPPSPSPGSLMPAVVRDENIRALRRLLLRKIPKRLDDAVDGVDKAGTWVGVAHAVVRNVQRNRL
ncbi:hypothetical protein M0805_006317 [Coniferiporia weirii]|nr:hypothetical protein M0805_006317 [Coniferiporia weirii]